MKKTIILVLVVFTSVLSTYGNDNDKSKTFGIRAGWHYAQMVRDGNWLAATEPLNTFYIGGFTEKKLAKILYFGSGLEYFKNGFESTIIDMRRELHYLSVPLYLKLKIGPLYATGGTALNFKIYETNKVWEGATDPLEGNKSNIFDLPLQAGLGIKIFMFSIEARYNWGMLDINHDVRNQYLQLGAAIFF